MLHNYKILNKDELFRFPNSTKINWEKNIGRTIIIQVDDNIEELLIVDKINRKLVLRYENIDYPIDMTCVVNESFDMIFRRLTVTNPEYIKYFFNGIEDAKQSSMSSTKKFDMVCPDCGRIKKYDMHHFTRSGYLPCVCRRNNMSYPERCMFSVLEQIGIKFVREYKFEWMIFEKQNGDKTYGKSDFVLPDYKIIIEMDGNFHYKEVNMRRTLSETIHADKMKDLLAFKNGYETIRIPSEVSTVEYLKDKIVKSKLSNVLDLSKVNWEIVLKFCQSNIAKEICEYKNRHKNSTTTDIAEYFQMSGDTVRKILKTGTEIGWCVYDKSFEEKLRKLKVAEVLKDRNTNNLKPVYQYSIEGKFIQEYSCLSEAAKTIGMTISSLSAALNNQTLCKGFQWSRNKLEYMGVYENKKAKAVLKFDLNTGVVLQTYKSIAEASIDNNIERNSISLCCLGKGKSAGGFGFKYNDGMRIELNNYKRRTTGKMVVQFDKNNNYINLYTSCHDANRKTGVDYRKIWNVCKGRQKTAGGYIWRYADEDVKIEYKI